MKIWVFNVKLVSHLVDAESHASFTAWWVVIVLLVSLVIIRTPNVNVTQGREEMPDKLKELTEFDFPDTAGEQDGPFIKHVPDATRANFVVLIEAHNKLVDVTNALGRKQEVIIDAIKKLNGFANSLL